MSATPPGWPGPHPSPDRLAVRRPPPDRSAALPAARHVITLLEDESGSSSPDRN
ncbi:hypothetical protein [Streptomyces hygroscopicus]|uniref:hypothetical protein n=1 Tax=Streptomyces hygroscopicus TaxID=1912 RepID=UPI00129C9BAC|nr:hypothetical protein [Streptomyces sp. NBRC 109436]